MTPYKPRYNLTGAKKFFIKLGFTPKSLEKLSQEEADNIIDDFFSMPILNQKEISVLISRYGLADSNALTLENIGKIFNLTRERINQIENKAIKKINYPKEFNKNNHVVERKTRTRSKIITRLKNLIPGLEYDVFYSPSFLLERIGCKRKDIQFQLNSLLQEFDLASIRLFDRAPRIMRIGEQEQDLPIISTPISVPVYDREYYVRCWENLARAIETKGYATYGDSARIFSASDKSFYENLIKDFIAENELPVALPQEYRQGIRKPLVVYHPKILRQIQHKQLFL